MPGSSQDFKRTVQVQGGEVADEITRPTKAGKAAETLVRGAMAACAIIDDVCQAAKEEDDDDFVFPDETESDSATPRAHSRLAAIALLLGLLR